MAGQGRDLRWHRNETDTFRTSGNGSIVWHGGGMAPSALHLLSDPIQHLWKLVLALGYMSAWKGHLWKNVNTNQTDLEFNKNTIHYVSACVRLPYLLIVGPAQWHSHNYSITCHNFSSYTCLNSSMPFDQSQDSIYILKA